MEKQDEIIVVGAGVFGLSAAWFLAKNGAQIASVGWQPGMS